MHAWTRQQLRAAGAKAPEVHFFGAKCGPQPILLLPPCTGALGTFAPLLRATSHAHGAVTVPYGDVDQLRASMSDAVERRRALARQLRGDCSSSANVVTVTQPAIDASVGDGFLTEYCHTVVDAMDRLGVSWVTCVAQAFGALAAAKLATLFPERVGSIFLLNTPLVSDETAAYAKQLRVLRAAAADVNVPEAMFRYALDEELVPPPAASLGMGADEAVAAAALGPPTKALAEGDVNAWMTHAQQALLRHPLCLTAPADVSKDALASTTAVHEAWFNVRRVAKLKAASAGFDVADDKIAAELANHLAGWIKRFDADDIVARRWSQAKQSMIKMLPPPAGAVGDAKASAAAAAAAAVAAAGGSAGKGGKKGGKDAPKDAGKKKEKGSK